MKNIISQCTEDIVMDNSDNLYVIYNPTDISKCNIDTGYKVDYEKFVEKLVNIFVNVIVIGTITLLPKKIAINYKNSRNY